MLSVDPNALPRDIDQLQKLVAELCERLKHETSEKDKYRSLLRELLDAERNRKSEQLSKDQLALFETLWKANDPGEEEEKQKGAELPAEEEQKPEKPETRKRSGRQALARHLVRERVVHDLAASEKHCDCCGKDLHLVGEETSERYEFIPAVMKVIEDVRLKYACDCTMKRADKPAQLIEKSTAGASVLAQVIVSRFADHLPLHRQEKIFERHGVEISRKTMGGWMAQCGARFEVLYSAARKVLFQSKVIGTDDTGVKVLDPSLNFARTGRIWPYVGDVHHPVVVYDYTATRGRDGPAKFLEGYTGYLQADAYSVYDAFFKPARGLIEVGCMMHARRYFIKALDSDQTHGSGAASDRASVCGGGPRPWAQRGRTAGFTEAAVEPGGGEAQPVFAPDPRRGFAEESSRQGGALRAKSVGGADALPERWRSGDRQWRYGASQPGHRHWSRQLDVLRQRRWRQNGRHLDELHRDVQAEYGRAIRLVPGCAVAHRDTSHQPNRRPTAAQVEGTRTSRLSSLKSIENPQSRVEAQGRITSRLRYRSAGIGVSLLQVLSGHHPHV